MSLLQPKLECDLHEDVLPWLMSKKETFSTGQDDAVKMADHLIEHGIMVRSKAHAKTMKARRDRERNVADDAAMAGVRQQERRAERKAAREKRAKDQAKSKMRDEIRRILIDKGQVVQPVTEQILTDIHGGYQRGGQFLGALGGQFQQIYYAVNAIH